MRAGAAAARRWACAVLLVLMTALPSSARERGPLAPPDVSSPQATVRSFLALADELEQQYTGYRQERTRAALLAMGGQLDRMRALFDLRNVPPALRLKIGGEAIASLMDVLARLPAVDVAAAPAAGPEQWMLPETEITLVRLADGPRKGGYVFSADTVDRLPGFRERVMHLPLVRPSRYVSMRDEQVHLTGPLVPAALVEAMPGWMQATFLGTPRWKVVATLLGLALLAWLNVAWGRIAARIAARLSATGRLAVRFTRPALLAASIWAFHLFINYQVNVQGRIAEAEFVLFSVVCYLAAAWAVWVAAFLVVEAVIASPRIPDSSYDAQLLRLLGQILALVGAGAIVVYGANEVGIPALGLFAGLGIGSLAVALAAKPTVENLFGGVTIFADRPFRVGDTIRYGTVSGVVEAVGPRSSRIRGLDGTLTTVPNADLATMQITNVSNRDKCVLQHAFGLQHPGSPDAVARVLDGLRQRIAAHPAVAQGPDSPRVRLVGFGPSSIRIDVRADVATTDHARFLAVQEQLILEIMKAVDEAGMTLAPA